MSFDTQAAALFDEGLTALALNIANDKQAKLGAYLESLQALSTRVSVTSAKTEAEWVETVLLDSLVLTRWIHGEGTVCDVGSGFGLPAIPIAIAEPGVKLILVERSEKRCVHLRRFARDFGVAADVRCADVATMGRIDATWFTARAFAEPNAWRDTALQIAPPGATVLTLHAGASLPGERYILPFSKHARSVEVWTAP